MVRRRPGILIFMLKFMILVSIFQSKECMGQQIQADVKIILDRLPLEKQQKLRDLSSELTNYISQTDWTGESFEKPVQVTIQIYLQDKSVSYEDRYSGTFLISNNLDLQYFDKYWRFPYMGETIKHDGIYDPLTGFLDFYVYLLLGAEYDRFARLGGTPYFSRARQISEQAKFNSVFILGWKEREELLNWLDSAPYESFRLVKDRFYLGLSYVGEQDSTAQRHLRLALTDLETVLSSEGEHKDAKQFLQAHFKLFADNLRQDREALKLLLRLDPEHNSLYEQYLEEIR